MRRAGALLLGLTFACSRNDPVPKPVASIAALPPPPSVSAPAAPAASAALPPLPVPPELRYEPTGLSPGEQRPLLLFLHGLGASGRIAFDRLGLQKLGERERVHIVAPDGFQDSKGRKFWNAHPACCDFDGKGVDDSARLGELLARFAEEPHVDPRRLYVVGFSNGGFMAHRLACEHGDRIAAVASIAGAGPAPDSRCRPATELGVLEVHGDADTTVRYEGGHLFGKLGLPSHASAESTLGDWGRRLGCEAEPQPGPALDLESRLPGPETATRSFAGCRGGSAALWTVRGGNHYIGLEPAFHREIWGFLSKHAKPSLKSPG